MIKIEVQWDLVRVTESRLSEDSEAISSIYITQ